MRGIVASAVLVLLVASGCIFAAESVAVTTVTVEAVGDSVVLAFTVAGGWPADMEPYYGADLVLLVNGVEVSAAIPTGWTWTEGDTVYVRRLLQRRVCARQVVTVARCEAGHAESGDWRTWAIPAGCKVLNTSRVYPWSTWFLGARW